MCRLFFSPTCWTDKRRPDAPSALHRIRVSAGAAGPARELDSQWKTTLGSIIQPNSATAEAENITLLTERT
jgi:hypothetical protein